MNASRVQTNSVFELRFRDLRVAGRAYAFACDARGRVDLDALGESARNDYFFARAVVGRVTSLPLIARQQASALA